MANLSSRARAAYKQNTAVLYYEPSASEETPVSTARIVPVGAANAARGGATLQLVGGMIESGGRQPMMDDRLDSVVEQPQVVQVEPPAPGKRPGQKGPTRVIAYNVRIVAESDEQAYDATAFEEEAGTSRMPMPQEPPFAMPQPSHRHREMQFDVPHRPGKAANRAPQDVKFSMPARGELPNDGRFDVPNQRAARAEVPFEGAEGRTPRGPMAGSIPMSLFGALENVGGVLHEQTRRVAARAQASVAAGSYKQMLAQQLDAGRGGLLSNRNMCIAVSAYALILFLLAVFTG